jgi:D-tyrosyl-tRNA(Tyr) deacylase
VGESQVSQIGEGLLLLVGIYDGDGEEDVDYVVGKTLNMRLFPNCEKNFDRSVMDTEGSLLLVSQFTLCADTRKGRRPGFSRAMVPDRAAMMFSKVVNGFRNSGLKVEEGVFQSHMDVVLINDGPVTILVDSRDR